MRTTRDSSRTKNFSRGFTVIELLVVIAILAALLAMSAMSFQSFLSNYRVNGASRQFLSDLGMVKINAIKNNTPWALEVAGSVYCIKNPGPDGNWQNGCTTGGSDDNIIKTVNITSMFPGISTTYTSNPASLPFRVIFNADATSAGTYTVTIYNGTTCNKVGVSQYTGSIKIAPKGSPCP